MHRISRFAIVAGVAFSVAACSDRVSGPAPITSDEMGVTSVTVAPASLTLAVHRSFTTATRC